LNFNFETPGVATRVIGQLVN